LFDATKTSVPRQKVEFRDEIDLFASHTRNFKGLARRVVRCSRAAGKPAGQTISRFDHRGSSPVEHGAKLVNPLCVR
jgi:hypothetical protein